MKTTKEMAEIMQAYVNGEALQIATEGCDNWVDLVIEPVWNWGDYDYRVKPEKKEPTYRPYKDTDDMVSDYCQRFVENPQEHEMPLIWVKLKHTTSICLITGYSNTDNNVKVASYWRSFKEFFNYYEYLDGTPCGKLVEE